MTNEQKLNYFRKALPEIQQLQLHELDEFMQEQSLRNLPSDVLDFLHKAVAIRRKESAQNILTVEHSNIKLDDIA